MKFTLGWLKDHLETEASVGEIAERLTMIGHEVEAVVDRGAAFHGFVVAEVLAAGPHPNADKLRVCTVDTGTARVQVVCGAPNARAGLKGVFAAPGAYIPGLDVTLKPASIRGVDSVGMLLSERELALSDEHTGIIELAADAKVGAGAAEALGLADPLIDVGITPNRGDCLGVRGLARDLAAAGMGRLKPLAREPVAGSFASAIGVELALSADAAGACPYFVGRLVRGVRNGPSPQWLQDRLRAVGLRPISALVDITNYITLDLCRPLHVFDADLVHSPLRVRLARPGETMETLNERTVELDAEMTVIADDAGAEALGGVMGGARTGCTAETVNVFIEAAVFDPARTAATGRKLNLNSDARYRFERGIDPAFLIDGMEIATRMVLELCGGNASELVIAGAEPPARPPVSFRPKRVAALTGVEVEPDESRRILAALGFAIDDGRSGAKPWRVGVPSWRNDIDGEACLVEEIVRIYGYDRIPTLPLARETALPRPALTPEQRRRALVRRLLAGRGLIEAVTYSFLSAERAALFGGGGDDVRLVNPISVDLAVMRPSLLANLIDAAKRNADRGQADAALFEVGPQYAGAGPEDQANVAAGIRWGWTHPKVWARPRRAVDVYDAKADALAILDGLGVPTDKVSIGDDAPAWYHPGRSGAIRLGPKTTLAYFGEVHPKVLRRLGAPSPVVAFEVFFAALPRPKAEAGKAKPPLRLSALQPLERDFAFVVDTGVPAEAVARAARAADKALISEVRVFDVFVGGNVDAGKKSLAITVVLQPSERTLTDVELDAFAGRVVASVEKATGGTLRA